MSDEQPHAVEDPQNEEVAGRIRTILTVAIAVTTLAIATVGFYGVRASSRSAASGQAAQKWAAETMSSLLQSQEIAKVDYETFLRAQQQQEQAGNAFQQAVFSSRSDKALLALVQERFLKLSAKTQALTPITPNGTDGPNQDPTFPRHLFSRASSASLFYEGLEDAANARNSAWESRGTAYTSILTLLAVALYLFGLAIALPRRIFKIFAYVGAGLLVLALGWAIKVTADSPSAIPDTAAQEYADGEVALETSTIGRDAAGFQTSIDSFTKAIDDWPGFARAYLGRANAALSTAPQLEAALIPTTTLERVASDLKHAESLGLGGALVYEQLAGTDFALALHGRPSLYRDAAAAARQAIAEVPDDPVGRYSLAVALLGSGDEQAARSAYGDALEATLFLDPVAGTPRDAPQQEQGWVSGALSDLEALRSAKPDLGTKIDRMEGLVVGSIASGSVVEPSGNASFSGVQTQVLPSGVAWASAGVTGWDRSKAILSVQWFTRQTGTGPWIGMPEVSGPVDPSTETTVPRFSTRNITSRSLPPRCLGSGDYRVELFVGGHMAGSAETTVAAGSDAVPFIDRAVNLEICHPADWQISRNALPGFRQGLASPDGTKGVYLFRYDLSLLPGKLRRKPLEAISQGLLESTVQSSHKLFPARPTQASAVQHQPSLGLPGSSQVSFFYAGGVIYGQCSIDTAGNAAYVTLVYGPQTSFVAPSGDLLPVVESLAEYAAAGSI